MKEKVIKCKTLPARIKKVREVILSAGNTIGSVSFVKRSDNELRKMSFRLHVSNPSVAPKPSTDKKNKWKDKDNLQLTVLDANKVIRDKEGVIIGRGAYRTIPLENVERIAVRGKVYKVEK
jgi:hypothetical protein